MSSRTLTSVLAVVSLMLVAACNEVDDSSSDDATGEAAAIETPLVEPDPTPSPGDDSATPIASPAESSAREPVRGSMEPADDSGAILDELELDDLRMIPPTFWEVDSGPDGELYLIYNRSMILVLSGEGEPIDAWDDELDAPFGLAVDGRGVVTVSDQRVHQFESDGTYLGYLRTGGFLRGERLDAYALGAAPDNTLYMSHSNEAHLTWFSADGEGHGEIPEARQSEGGPGSRIDFDQNGRMFLLATGPPNEPFIEVRDPEGEVLYKWALEEYTDETGETHWPSMKAVTPDGRVVTVIALIDEDTFEQGSGILPMARDYVVQIYSVDGELQTSWKAVADTDLEVPLWMPSRFTIDQNNVLILPDGGLSSHRIQRFTLDGEFLGEWGHGIPAFLCERGFASEAIDCD